MPLYTYQDAQKVKKPLETLSGTLSGDEYQIVEYNKSGQYYVRRKPKRASH